MWLVMLGAFLPWLGVFALTMNGPYRDAVFFSGIVVVGAIALFGYYAASRSYAILRRHRGLVCHYCSYPLDAIEGDRCPECGQRFEPEHLRMRWAQHFPALKGEDWCPRDVPPLDCGGHG